MILIRLISFILLIKFAIHIDALLVCLNGNYFEKPLSETCGQGEKNACVVNIKISKKNRNFVTKSFLKKF